MAYVKTQIAKAMGFKEDTTNKAELSLVDSYYEVQLAVVNKPADELRESMTVHMKYEHGLITDLNLNATSVTTICNHCKTNLAEIFQESGD